ncbi:MAG TPA: hypothetical protein VF498_00940 [Anaerolineales bacterium]
MKTLAAKALYLLCGTLILYLLFSNQAYDDPFITYRYAANLAHGLGFVYNPGERVLSTTTPLFALLLALLSAFSADLPHLANLIGAFSLALGGLFLWDLAQTWKAPLAGWVCLLIYPTFPLLLTTLGSETPLYLALCLGAFASYARQKYLSAAAFSALALLARPDGALVPVLLAADFVLGWIRPSTDLRRPEFPWAAILLFFGLALPWFIFAWGYFGSPLPATLAAKQQQGAMAISQRFAPGFLALAGGYAVHWTYRIEAVLALLGGLWMLRKGRPWLLLLVWTVLYFAAYSILGVSRYTWYYAPLVPGFAALVGLGFEAIYALVGSAAGSRTPGTDRRISPAAGLPVLAVLGLLAVGQAGDLRLLSRQTDPRVPAYRAVGDWLRENTPAGARVGALEVGVIGFYAQRPMIDFAGLIQPEVARQMSASSTYADTAMWAVEHYRPDYLVLHEGNFARLEQSYVPQHCRLARRFPGSDYGYSANLDIYSCP